MHAPDLLDGDGDGDDSPAGPSVPATPAGGVPPRPPNPELLRLHDRVHAKLSSELASLSQAMTLDAERLRANQTDLLAGEPAIRDEMARLEAVRDVCQGVAARLEQVVAVGERNVGELRRKGDPEVDEVVCSTTIVYNQSVPSRYARACCPPRTCFLTADSFFWLPVAVASSLDFTPFSRNQRKLIGVLLRTHACDDCNRLINLVAEDNAIEDTIYHLHRALNAGRIDLERFLRVRLPIS